MHLNEFVRATTLSALAAGFYAVTPSLAAPGPVLLRDIYDFIVVGGGTAGLTVASRLSEDPSVSVLVLEAGPPDHQEKEVMVPWFSAVGFMRAPYGWGIYYDLFGQRVDLNQGKVLGGDSIKHAMVYDRPVPGDLAAFKQLGIEGWSHEEILPYLNKLETFTPPYQGLVDAFGVTYDERCHGFDGPLQVGWNNYFYPQDVAFQSALDKLGVHRAHDPGCDKMGSFIMASSLSQANQSRSDARRAHYDPNAGRPNLTVLTGQQALKVLVETAVDGGSGTPRATGVEFAASADEPRSTVKANKEVIVSAGALRTPHLLMHSGIGDSKALLALNITPVVDLPGVGYNLQDQFTVPVTYNVTAAEVPTDKEEVNYSPLAPASQAFDEAQQALYYANRTGRWTKGYATVFAYLPAANITSINGDALPFVASVNDTEDGLSIPATVPPTVAAGYRKQLAVLRRLLTTGAMAALEVTFVGGGTFVTATDLHPLSRGTVVLNGSDPWANPAVDPRYLAHPKDGRALAAGVRLMRRIVAQDVVEGTLGPVELDPGPQRVQDVELQAWMGNLTTKGNHHCGTCAMLPRDLGGVVDAELKVYGARSLRVVDASVLTVAPSAHMQATVFAIGEKAADLIKKDWGLK